MTDPCDNCKRPWCYDCQYQEDVDGQLRIMKINSGNYGEKLYAVTLGTGLAWTQTFEVYAYYEQEAVDLVADYCEDHELEGLYSDYWKIANECEFPQTVDEYAEANGLTCCGNHGIYMQILGIKEVK